MVANTGFKPYSKKVMGKSLTNGWLSTTHPEEASIRYEKFVEENNPDLLVLLGSPDYETSRRRAEGLVSNLHYFSEEHEDLDATVLTPEEELEWNEDLLEEAASDYKTDIEISEDYLGSKLETTLDDVLAADMATEQEDNIMYHTTAAHAKAVKSAAETIHQDSRRYTVLRFGRDKLALYLARSKNAFLQKHYYP